MGLYHDCPPSTPGGFGTDEVESTPASRPAGPSLAGVMSIMSKGGDSTTASTMCRGGPAWAEDHVVCRSTEDQGLPKARLGVGKETTWVGIGRLSNRKLKCIFCPMDPY